MHDTDERQPLSFRALDGLAFSAQRGRLRTRSIGCGYFVNGLGPLMEWIRLSDKGLLPHADSIPWLALGGLTPLYAAIRSSRISWVSPNGGWLGLFKNSLGAHGDDAQWSAFKIAAHKAALAAGYQSKVVSQLMGALGEIQDNIFEHSQAAETGVIAFRASPGIFEFSVSDLGVGVLVSLKTNPEYARLDDHGHALLLALTDGISRHGDNTQHGGGFRQLFKGVASLNATLRFRSGDHALAMEGVNPTLLMATSSVRPPISGFLANQLS